jgi:hypothetical protein
MQSSSFELHPTKTVDHQKGNAAYSGANPGAYTSAAATGVGVAGQGLAETLMNGKRTNLPDFS